MRRFELVEGSSSKFWEVDAAGTEVTVRFGRIGTAGQTKTHSHADAATAQKELDKLVKEKTRKGYAETGVAAETKLAPVATPPPAPAPAQAAEAAPAPAPAAMPAAALTWPAGGFQWTAELRAELPVLRGIHAPTPPDGRALLAHPLVLVDDPHGFYATRLAEMAQAAGRQWAYWGEAESRRRITPASLAQRDAAFWFELLAQVSVAPLKPPLPGHDSHSFMARQDGTAWLADVGIALHGLPFMLELVLDIARVGTGHRMFAFMAQAPLAHLRGAIAAADEATHDEAVALLERQAAGTPLDRQLRAYLCPHRADWVAQALQDGAADERKLLLECVMPPEAAVACMKGVYPYMDYVRGALLLQVHLHGEAAFPVLAQMQRKAVDRDSAERFLALTLRMQVPGLVPLLTELIERKETRAALDKLSDQHPAAVLKTVVEHAHATRSRLAEGWAVRLALRQPAALAAVLPLLEAPVRERFGALLAELHSESASPEQLPPVLRSPPWLGKARATELPTLELPTPPLPDRLAWSSAERERHAGFQVSGYRLNRTPLQDRVAHFLTGLKITRAGQARVLAGQPLQADDVVVGERWFSESPEVILLLPDAAGLAVWNSYPSVLWQSYEDIAPAILAVLARHGEAAIPGLARYAQSYAADGLRVARHADSPGLVPTALHALRNLKKARPHAVDWLRAHAATACAVALPLAFGKDKAARDDAAHGLRWLVANGHEDAARAAATAQGPAVQAGLQALLDADPLRVLPARMPKLPNFFVAASFRRPLLRDSGAALPPQALEHVGSMLAISRIEAPYAGLELVRQACQPATLAEFAWDLFEAWLAAGAPSKDAWAFQALGHLGDDETARRLAPRIREWPGESAHQRAVAGLDLLAAIGSDVALMHLNGIASKVKFKALQDRAKEKITAVAEQRGLSAAELADRLVPDLGLEDDGTLCLDFGPRRFFVGFDEALKPYVKDAQGLRLKDLPKPVKSDDTALAEAATERYKQIKKDAKAVASLQVIRLELAMVERRRWPAADFRLFFLEHPLMRHLATRLAWGVYGDDGALQTAFRVAEDWTLADADDALYTLPEGAAVGIAHVLEMPAPLQAAFGQVFADYEILQPFRQLGRETFTLTEAERKASKIERYAQKVVATGSVMGLVNRGWERGQAQDAGWIGWFSKRVGDGLEVDVELDPGTTVGDISYEPKQRLPAIVLRQVGSWDSQGLVNFERLDPLIASEVLRDMELLAPLKE